MEVLFYGVLGLLLAIPALEMALKGRLAYAALFICAAPLWLVSPLFAGTYYLFSLWWARNYA